MMLPTERVEMYWVWYRHFICQDDDRKENKRKRRRIHAYHPSALSLSLQYIITNQNTSYL